MTTFPEFDPLPFESEVVSSDIFTELLLPPGTGKLLSLEILKSIANGMQGKTFHHHLHILYDLRSSLGPDPEKKKKYLEIGTYNGGSACLMMLHPFPTDIYCIDPLNLPGSKGRIEDPPLNLSSSEEQFDITLKNFNKFNIFQREVKVIRGYSSDFDRVLRPVYSDGLTFDLILIDGSHKYQDVINDFVNYYSLLNQQGYLVFDDYHDKGYSPEVRVAVDHIVQGIKSEKFLGKFEIIGCLKNVSNASPNLGPDNNCFIIYRPILRSDIIFAVIIATYHRPNGKTKGYLKKAFECLRNQRYQNFKVFLIGDRYSAGEDTVGNNEKQEESEEFQSFRTELALSKMYMENLSVAHERDNCRKPRNLWTIGGANAMNHGLRKAREQGFKYTVHLDDDDLWHPNHLRNLAMAYEQFPNIVFACTKGIIGNSTSGILPYVSGYGPGNFIPKGNDCFHSCQSFRCDILPFEYKTLKLENGQNEPDYEPADLVMLRSIGEFIQSQGNQKDNETKWNSICVPHITCFRSQEHSNV